MKFIVKLSLICFAFFFLFQGSIFSQSLDEATSVSDGSGKVIKVAPQVSPSMGIPSSSKRAINSLTKSIIKSIFAFPSINGFFEFLVELLKELFLDKDNPQPGVPENRKKVDIASGSAPPPGVKPPPSSKTPALAKVPGRPSVNEGGSAFLARTDKLNPIQREEEIVKAILNGNIPDFNRSFKELSVKMKLKDGQEHTAVYKVMPDYLSIGTNSDFVRIPMSPLGAQKIADKFGCLLPTSKMVDDIYKQAQTQLYPQPMSSGNYPNWQQRMTKNEFYNEHQRLVETQRAKTAHKAGELIAGHKKDVIISNRLDARPKNVVIYGWHNKNNHGKPIQGYGTTHENTYADYSHGIRLIHQTMTVDGKEMLVADVLKDPVLSTLISNEGVMKDPRAIR